ncbi:DUF453-domain-containing protein [Marasmius fiardii PR-910]|nr:DUF453-domain-containing protein [Marasmius fiardii PR-910]
MFLPNALKPKLCSRGLTQMATRELSFKSRPTVPAPASLLETENPLPATFLRGGTSKGIFLNHNHIPSDTSLWPRIFDGIMGSPDPDYGRQLNGMGGGVSSLSKICLVKPIEEKERKGGGKYEGLDVDVEYTFVQVGIRESDIDVSGNCGNLSSMIGVFAVDEGMCVPRIRVDRVSGEEEVTLGSVRAFNTNTQKVIETTFPVQTRTDVDSETQYVPDIDIPQTSIAGVPGKASIITLDFHNPSGARTGKLLPTGKPKVTLSVRSLDSGDSAGKSIEASLVDAANPTVFVPYDALSSLLPASSLEQYTRGTPTKEVDDILESLRQQGAIQMGLDPAAKAQPKIALIGSPDREEDSKNGVDVVIHALSMGVLHKAVPMTVGLCLGVAAGVEGTVVRDVIRRTHREGSRGVESRIGLVRLRHPSGIVDVGAEFGEGGPWDVKSAKVVRTGRRLMKGHVWW